MYLQKSSSHGRTYLSIVQGYRINGKVKHKTIEKLGYLEDLKKEYDDPITHFKEIAKQKTKKDINEYTIKNLKTKIIDNSSKAKNLGYVALLYQKSKKIFYLIKKRLDSQHFKNEQFLLR